jgi:hypothetical protein
MIKGICPMTTTCLSKKSIQSGQTTSILAIKPTVVNVYNVPIAAGRGVELARRKPPFANCNNVKFPGLQEILSTMTPKFGTLRGRRVRGVCG